MEIGPQYKTDDRFKKKARLHQSIYRAEVLGVDYCEYGNRLTDADAKALLNYYDRLNCREALRARFPKYSRMREADLLRSEHIPFNMLAPLDTDRKLATGIIRAAFGITLKSITRIAIEYTPKPKEHYLNDLTAFDAYIEGVSTTGESVGIGVETKYTEKAYHMLRSEKVNVGNHASPYWEVARRSGAFIDPEDEALGRNALRQVWRNHLLGLAMEQRGEIQDFYSVTLHPAGNEHFSHVLPEYLKRLKLDHRRVIGVTFEQYLRTIGGSEDFDDWPEWLWRRYVVE